MKLNCLILAHKNTQQIIRLIKRLGHPDVRIFIHIDYKWKISDEDYRSLTTCVDNVYVLERRISTRLDDWSLVEASLALAAYAQRISDEPCYNLLMSGQDYPIKPIEELLQLLNQSYPKPYIDCTPYDDSNWVWHKFNHTSFSRARFRYTNRILRRLTKRLVDYAEHIVPASRRIIHRMKPYGLSLYGGSAWWCLPDAAIRDIIYDIENSPELIKLYQKSWTPEETFFQTFVMRSSVANLVEANPIDRVEQNCLTFAAFTPPTKKFCGHPHILLSSDYDWLMAQSDKYIARKFDTTVDSTILDKIDNT